MDSGAIYESQKSASSVPNPFDMAPNARRFPIQSTFTVHEPKRLGDFLVINPKVSLSASSVPRCPLLSPDTTSSSSTVISKHLSELNLKSVSHIGTHVMAYNPSSGTNGKT